MQSLASDLSHAVAHIHGLGIVHRDIKPANCVIFIRPNCPMLKLGDFGCARVAQPIVTPGASTCWLMAPELFHVAGGQGPGNSRYKDSIDVWSLGCVVESCFRVKSCSQQQHRPTFAKRSVQAQRMRLAPRARGEKQVWRSDEDTRATLRRTQKKRRQSLPQFGLVCNFGRSPPGDPQRGAVLVTLIGR